MTLDLNSIRAQFPALKRHCIYFDNPGGTQVAQPVLNRMNDYLVRCNANKGGAFATAHESDEVLHAAHDAMAAFFNCAPDETVFGANMTTITLHVSRSLARDLQAGDEIVLTRLDHDANVSPWLLIAQDRGAAVRWVDINPEDCTLKMEDFARLINAKTKIVAVGYASNAVGTINDIKPVIDMAHSVGAIAYIDAVQYAPHALIDVQALDCDFLVCSAYKFFGPHEGILYGKREHLDRLMAYKVRPAPNEPPGKWETGTQNHECIAGTLGAIEYFEWLGGTNAKSQRERIATGMQVLVDYERELGGYLINGLQSINGIKVWGITDPQCYQWRVPTVSFTRPGWHPLAVAEYLGQKHINVWDGNYYAFEIMERLGLQASGGMVRVGLAHYNTHAEVDQLVATLQRYVP